VVDALLAHLSIEMISMRFVEFGTAVEEQAKRPDLIVLSGTADVMFKQKCRPNTVAQNPSGQVTVFSVSPEVTWKHRSAQRGLVTQPDAPVRTIFQPLDR
jgi:hypothetical protein